MISSSGDVKTSLKIRQRALDNVTRRRTRCATAPIRRVNNDEDVGRAGGEAGLISGCFVSSLPNNTQTEMKCIRCIGI